MQVAREWHGRHVGTRLLTTLEGLAWQAHMRKVVLTVFSANTQAQAFYERNGYLIDATSPAAGDAIHYMILCKPHPDMRAQTVDSGERAEDPKRR